MGGNIPGPLTWRVLRRHAARPFGVGGEIPDGPLGASIMQFPNVTRITIL